MQEARGISRDEPRRKAAALEVFEVPDFLEHGGVTRSARPTFSSEAALCASWMAAVTAEGWTCYAETSGWDILAVKEGIQVGVQAKLKANLDVLAQSVASDFAKSGPHYAAVLVPHSSGAFYDVARALGLLVIEAQWRSAPWRRPGDEDLPRVANWCNLTYLLERFPPLHFDTPAWVPPDVPDLPAGVPCPVQFTAWKYQALQLLARLAVRGYVTGKDFAEIGLSRSRWYHHWLVPMEPPSKRPERWVKKPGVRLADEQHPDIFAPMVESTRASMGAAAKP